MIRPVVDSDIDAFFSHQCDPETHWWVGFTSNDPTDRAAFAAHWARILADPTTLLRTIVHGGRVVGYVGSFLRGEEREVTYWIDRADWGRGIATAALAELLRADRHRPLHARVAADHRASQRVLEKCGFAVIRRERGYAAARGQEIEELVFALRATEEPGRSGR